MGWDRRRGTGGGLFVPYKRVGEFPYKAIRISTDKILLALYVTYVTSVTMAAKTELKMVRLEPDVARELTGIQRRCPWPTDMKVLASFAARNGLAATRKNFNPKTK